VLALTARAGFTIADYGLNDYGITATQDERFEVIIVVATREVDTVNKIAARLAQIAVSY
jgi:hypothetical protein